MIDIYIFVFITGMLWHELWHIKSQGLRATGEIYVHKYGLTCICRNTWNEHLRKFAGGGITAIMFLYLTIRTIGEWRYIYLLNAMLQLISGITEWKYNEFYLKYRYYWYILFFLITIIIMIIF